MQDINPVPLPFAPIAVGFILLGLFAGLSMVAPLAAWTSNPRVMAAVSTGLFVLAMILLVKPCWPLLHKPTPPQAKTRNETEGSTS
ncbi:hypothetical protein C7401_102301 [Paraburkholderia unamae]|uniref:hypothetical protein n=1 Tax=Paraburkholderia unamae TaxID=219649 RepID=UPI000DC4B440|nr:hypothetical protein [Paraburkholderia unamae]RAR66876.1 hypothetical protein C7401_102301 [Paraburkholderia unamae]